MQRHRGPRQAPRVQRRQQPVGEMQPRRRRRHRAQFRGEDGLVILPVAPVRPVLAGNIGRQRRHPGRVERGIERLALAVEGEPHLAALALGHHRRAQRAAVQLRAERQHVGLPKLFRGPCEGVPTSPVDPFVQGRLDPHRTAPARKPRRDHFRVVAHQQIARLQTGGQLRDQPVRQPRGADLEQPGPVARARRARRDALPRQLEFELGNLHRPRPAGPGWPARN